jgi:hypothetical protein
MTTTDTRPLEAPVGPGTSIDPTVRQRVRRNRVLALAGAVCVVGAFVVALGSGTRGGDLDPRSYEHTGSHAIATLLASRGVRVATQTDATLAAHLAVAGTTLVVVSPQLLTDDELAQLSATKADLVVVGARLDALQGLGLSVATELGDAEKTRDPGCSLGIATVAGSAQLGGDGYDAPSGGQGCYPDGDGFALVTFPSGGRQITLLSDGTPFENTSLPHEGNAALALGLLDVHPDVVWLVPPVIAPESGSGGTTSLTDLLPGRLKAAVVQLVVAVVIIAVWRGRRLGRLVPEELPVVVRQSETVRGRSRLYRRARSLDRASQSLRDGSRYRLAQRLGQGGRPQRAALIDAVVTRTRQPAAQVDALLYGSTPTDDRALVTLANALAALEQEVFRT